MGKRSRRPDDTAHFRERYRAERSNVARRLEQQALGHAVGLNGYTTVEEADRLAVSLDLTSEQCLLDLGAGRGWPGFHVARTMDCRVITTDIPREALVEARDRMIDPAYHPHNAVLAADGTALPFPDHSFDGISHADVFC